MKQLSGESGKVTLQAVHPIPDHLTTQPLVHLPLTPQICYNIPCNYNMK